MHSIAPVPPPPSFPPPPLHPGLGLQPTLRLSRLKTTSLSHAADPLVIPFKSKLFPFFPLLSTAPLSLIHIGPHLSLLFIRFIYECICLFVCFVFIIFTLVYLLLFLCLSFLDYSPPLLLFILSPLSSRPLSVLQLLSRTFSSSSSSSSFFSSFFLHLSLSHTLPSFSYSSPSLSSFYLSA